jgi:hypothetical protein
VRYAHLGDDREQTMTETSHYGAARAEWSAETALLAGMRSKAHLFDPADRALKHSPGRRPELVFAVPVPLSLKRRVAKKAALTAFGVLRPVVRSLAWRARTFLSEDLNSLRATTEHSALHMENLVRQQHGQVVALLRKAEAHSVSGTAEQRRAFRTITAAQERQAKEIKELRKQVAQLKKDLATVRVDDE